MQPRLNTDHPGNPTRPASRPRVAGSGRHLRAARALLAAALAACAVPAGASAATSVELSGGTLSYRADPEKTNSVDVYDGEVSVGEVAIQPREGRLRAMEHVSVMRRFTRIVRHGKTVTARLALRLHPSLVGRRLRLEVEAVDVRGARQVERRAGSIRLTR